MDYVTLFLYLFLHPTTVWLVITRYIKYPVSSLLYIQFTLLELLLPLIAAFFTVQTIQILFSQDWTGGYERIPEFISKLTGIDLEIIAPFAHILRYLAMVLWIWIFFLFNCVADYLITSQYNWRDAIHCPHGGVFGYVKLREVFRSDYVKKWFFDMYVKETTLGEIMTRRPRCTCCAGLFFGDNTMAILNFQDLDEALKLPSVYARFTGVGSPVQPAPPVAPQPPATQQPVPPVAPQLPPAQQPAQHNRVVSLRGAWLLSSAFSSNR